MANKDIYNSESSVVILSTYISPDSHCTLHLRSGGNFCNAYI